MSPLESLPRLLIGIGIVLVVVGVVWLIGGRFGLGRLPGDIYIERENFSIYIPITTMILISIVISAILWLLRRM